MKIKGLVDRNVYKHIDWVIMVLICAIVFFGIITLVNVTADPFSGEENTLSEIFDNLNLSTPLLQFAFFLIGIGLIMVIMLIDYNNLRPYIKYIYWVCVALLVIVLFFGTTHNGTTGWFMIGDRGFQPSEFCKIALILTFSKVLADYTEGNNEGITKISQLIPVLWRFMIPFLLVVAQPDFGTALVYIAIFIGILFFAKASIKIFLVLFGLAGGSIPIVWSVLQDWQKDRIYAFFDESYGTADTQYQAQQAKLAIGSGQLTGRGMFAEGSMSQLGYVPADSNDFIFSVTTETFGFIGAMILLILYALLIARTVILAIHAKDDFGTYICIGVTAMVLFHIFENVGMNIGLMPITGIPLPFFSYGGSNLIVCMIAYAMVLNVNARRQRWPFKT